MNFVKAQTDLVDLTMDTSTEWAVAGDKNKKALNKGFEMLYDMYKNYEKVKRRIKVGKTKVTITDKVGNLPADFDTIDIVSLFDFATDSDIAGMSDGRYYDFEIRGVEGTKKIYLEGPYTELYISYIPRRTDLVNDADVFPFPEELSACIIDFGYVWYNRMIRDDIGAANALQLAQSIMDTKLASI